MKVKFDEWEIEIKAKNTIVSSGENYDTKMFLNFLSILYGETAELLRKEAKEEIKKDGDPYLVESKVRLAAKRDKASFDIYNALAETGLYDDIH